MSQEPQEPQEAPEGPEIRDWTPLQEVLGVSHPFFKDTLFIEGYDISSNVYAITGEYVSLIDAGNDYTAFIQLFNKGYKPTDIKKIVVTHGHREHVMGILELFRYPSIQQERDLEIFVTDSAPEALVELVREFGCKLTEVKNGDILDLSGHQLEVVHTPGHTMDSICLYHSSTKSIFTGDTVIPQAVASPDPTGGGRADYHLFSLRILMNMGLKHLLPGHGMPVAHEAQKVLEGSYAGAIKQIIGLKTSWLEGASFLARKKYLAEAAFCCDMVLKEEPNNLKALELKASCLSDMGKFEEAYEIFDRLSKEIGNYTFANMGKGYSLLGMGKYKEAILYFNKVLKKNPAHKMAKVYKGIALYLSGKQEEALKIEEFKEEFVARFVKEVEKGAQERGESIQ